MGLQSFLSHAQDDPGTQEAIRRLLEKDDEPKPPTRFVSSPSVVDSPPTRTTANTPPPVDEALAGAPSYQPPILNEATELPPPTRILSQPIEPPLPSYTSPPPTRIDSRQGASTAGMSPMDAAQARIQTVQGASPQQRVNTSDPNFVEVGAPHGISRLKAAGRLFLDQLKHGHGLIGGLFGVGEGLIAPGHAQDLKHQQEVAEAQGNFNQVAANQKTQAQIEDINAQTEQRLRPKLEPPHEDFRAVTEGEYPGVEAGTQVKRVWNGTKFVDEVDDKGRPTIKALPPVRTPKNPDVQWVSNADGTQTGWVPDSKSATGWSKAGLPDKASPPDRASQGEEYGTAKTNAERAAKAEAAKSEAKQHSDMANALREQEAAARKQVADLWANPVKPSMVNNKPYEEWQRRIKEGEAQAERLRTQAESSDNKRIEAETRATEFGRALPQPPKRASGTPAPTTHGFSVSGWLRDPANTGKTEADAKAFHDASPKYKSYTIIP